MSGWCTQWLVDEAIGRMDRGEIVEPDYSGWTSEQKMDYTRWMVSEMLRLTSPGVRAVDQSAA